jgi:hypothetical protein
MRPAGRYRQAATDCVLSTQFHKVFVETAVPVAQEGALRAAGAHDQADARTGNRRLCLVHPDEDDR